MIDQLIDNLTWLADVFERHGEAVIAAFTIVLALSTIGLWRATSPLRVVPHLTGIERRHAGRTANNILYTPSDRKYLCSPQYTN